MTGRVRGGVHVRSLPGEFVLAAGAVALVPAEPMNLFVAALTGTAAIVLAGFLRRPDRTSGRSRTESDPLEDRLAKALAASEFTRSVESHAISDALRSHISENAPPVRHVRTTSGRLAGGSGEDLPEAAVAAAYEVLSAEIGDRLEALRRREGDLRKRETEIDAERKKIDTFRDELAKSIEQLRMHQERLEEIERELVARLREPGSPAEVERPRE
ncbi:MAG TPA: hypothetical protein VJN63_12805 [Thermoplasmata archaeon]|nr:hypothetical protein [Thermoplasmata archaeon]